MAPHITFSVLFRSLHRIFAAILLACAVLVAIGGTIVVQAGRDEAATADTAILMLDGPASGQTARLDRAVRLYLAGQISRIVLAGGDTAQARSTLVTRGVVPDKVAEVRNPSEQGQIQGAQKLLQEAHVSDALLIGEPVESLRLLKMARDAGLDLRSAPTGADSAISLSSVAAEIGRYLVYCFAGR